MYSDLSKLQIVSEKTNKNCAVYKDSDENKKYDANIDQFFAKDFYFYDDYAIPNFFIKQVYFGRSLNNPAILPVSMFNLQNSTIFTEHMSNGSLESLLDKMSSRPESVSGTTKYIILLGISLGMKYLHSCNILHLGLSPDHIFLNENYYPKISGFMFSEHHDSATLSEYQGSSSEKSMMMTMIAPTISYYQSAPEIQEGPISYKTDVFSFALIAYQLLAKKDLQTQEKKNYSIRFISEDFHPNLECIDNVEIKDLVAHMWETNPIYRPNFNDISDEIKKDYFIEYFNADRQKVAEYTALFEK